MEYDHMIETFTANGSNHSLDIGSLPRRARCRLNFADAHISTCAYQKLRLILQRLLPTKCNNALHACLRGLPPQQIDRDVVDSVASRPR